jgi:hypothetical protein
MSNRGNLTKGACSLEIHFLDEKKTFFCETVSSYLSASLYFFPKSVYKSILN